MNGVIKPIRHAQWAKHKKVSLYEMIVTHQTFYVTFWSTVQRYSFHLGTLVTPSKLIKMNSHSDEH